MAEAKLRDLQGHVADGSVLHALASADLDDEGQVHALVNQLLSQ